MRGLPLLVLAVLLSVPLAAAVPGHVAYLEEEGWFRMGLLGAGTMADYPVLGPIDLAVWPIEVNACHRSLHADLVYMPEETAVGTDLVALVLAHEFRVDVRDKDGAVVGSGHIGSSGLSRPLGTVPAPGPYTVELRLVQGWETDWSLRVRGLPADDEAMCEARLLIGEVEADPPGDAVQWVELWNPGIFPVTLDGWSLVVPSDPPRRHMMENGTTVGPGGWLVVALPVGFLDTEDGVVRLEGLFEAPIDMTPTLSDGWDDDRTHQRVPDGGDTWAFLPATPGAMNGRKEQEEEGREKEKGHGS